MRVVFSRRFDWVVPQRKGHVLMQFEPGEHVVKRVVGELAVQQGAAVEVKGAAAGRVQQPRNVRR